MSTSTSAKSSAVTLKGSAQMVAEFFTYGVHSILYQRGIYPPESFTRKQEYGLTVLVSEDPKVNDFLESIMKQTKTWLEERQVKRMVVVLTSVDTKETLERWEFHIDYATEEEEGKENVFKQTSNKDLKKIQAEMRDVIRQITASVTFLPLLDCLCSFDILVYTNKDLEVPETFSESDAKLITNSEEVKLKSFSTGIHKVEASVSYKATL